MKKYRYPFIVLFVSLVLIGLLVKRGYIRVFPEDALPALSLIKQIPSLGRGMLVWEDSGRICLTRLKDRTTREITVGKNPRWSPDGEFIAFTRQDDVWIIDRVARRPTKVFSGVITRYGTGAYWSPDGRRLIMILKKNPRQVIAVSPQTGKITLIHDEGVPPFRGYHLSQSAQLRFNDRYLLTFTADNGHRSMIVDRIDRRYLTNRFMREGDCGPSWSPDGRFILMTRRVRASRNRPLFITFFNPQKGVLSESHYFCGEGWCCSASVSNDSKYVVYASDGNIFLCPVQEALSGKPQSYQLTSTGRGAVPGLFVFSDSESMWPM